MAHRLLLLLLLALLSAPAHAAEERPLLVLLTDPARQVEGISTDSFALALLLQLRPYEVDIQLSQWSLPSAGEDQEALASHRCDKTRAAAVVWYTLEDPRPPLAASRVTVQLVVPEAGAHRRLSMKMGAPEQGIERSMAIAVRTLVSARLAAFAKPAPKEPSPKKAPPPAPPPPEEPSWLAGRASVGAVYDLEIFPLEGIELRHGPTVLLGMRLYRGVRMQLGVGYRATNDGLSQDRWWSRDFLCVDLTVSHGWELDRLLILEAGGQIRANAVFASAGNRPGESKDSTTETHGKY